MHLGATFVPVVLGGSTSLSTTIRSNREYPDRIGWAVSMMCKSRDGVNDTHPGRIEPHQGLKRQESAGRGGKHPSSTVKDPHDRENGVRGPARRGVFFFI
jgi:hypothetical protein